MQDVCAPRFSLSLRLGRFFADDSRSLLGCLGLLDRTAAEALDALHLGERRRE